MPKEKPRKKRYLRSRITQRLILDTAEQVFLEKGYHKTTITEISKRANVGYGTVYSHFRGKNDLLNTIIDRTSEKYFNIMDDTEPVNDFQELFSNFEDNIRAFFHLASDQKEILKVFQQAIGQSANVSEHWNNKLEHFIEILAKEITGARKKGFVNKDLDVRIISKAMILTLEKYLWEIVHENETDLELLIHTLSLIFVRGLCAPESVLNFQLPGS